MTAVLLVEAEPAIHAVLKAILEARGLTVESAYSTGRASARCRAERPGLALVNLQLGESSGLECIGALHSLAPRMPIAALCGRLRSGDRDLALMQGANTFLTLPLDERRLADWLDDALEHTAGG